MLSAIHKRLRQAKASKETFGNTFVYLLGDIKQLPPVCDWALYRPMGKLKTAAAKEERSFLTPFNGVIFSELLFGSALINRYSVTFWTRLLEAHPR